MPGSSDILASLIINSGTVRLVAGAVQPPATTVIGYLLRTRGSYTYTPASNDLIAGLLPTVDTNTATEGVEGTGGTNLLTNQNITVVGNTPLDNLQTYAVGSNASLTYQLPPEGAAWGYDITAINLYAGWNDGGRSTITITDIAVSTVSESVGIHRYPEQLRHLSPRTGPRTRPPSTSRPCPPAEA